jgi:hypothetical protein
MKDRERAFVVDFVDLGTGGTFSDIVFLFRRSAPDGFLDKRLVGIAAGLLIAIPAVGSLDIFFFYFILFCKKKRKRKKKVSCE